MAAILTHALAEELLLSSVIRDFSGAVPRFHRLHRLFSDQYRQLEHGLDQLATRAWALASGTSGNMDELAAARCVALRERLPERAMIGELLDVHERLASRLRDDERECSQQLGDPSSADLLTRLVEFHETTAWLLRMVLEEPDSTRV